MKVTDELLNKFPCVLRKAIESKGLEFADTTEIEFGDFEGYRLIRRNNQDKNTITIDDFKSQAEQIAMGKNLRNVDLDDIGSYSCSVNTEIEPLKLLFKLPKKNKKIAKGIIRSKYGILKRDIDKGSTHVHWWLFQDADPSGDFEVIEIE